MDSYFENARKLIEDPYYTMEEEEKDNRFFITKEEARILVEQGVLKVSSKDQ